MNPEFLPKDDLAKFIVMEIVRPQLEAFDGIAFEAQTVFVTKNQRKPGPTIGAVKRAIPMQVEIHCEQILPHITQVICQGRLTQWPPPSREPLEWDLTARVLRDEKGFYVSGLSVAMRKAPEDAQ